MVVNITIVIIAKRILNIAVIVIIAQQILNITIVIIAKLTVGDLKERMEASFLSKQLA